MEYVTYILVILGIMAVCLFLIRGSGQSLFGEDDSRVLGKSSDRSPEKATAKRSVVSNSARTAPVLKKETISVPTPWGWPGHGKHVNAKSHALPNTEEVHDVSESLHRFVDRLISEKQTVESRDYLLKKDASLRALLEDRYGRVVRKRETENRSVKAPVLKPSEPLDVKTPWGW
jgi:hypothetical protein